METIKIVFLLHCLFSLMPTIFGADKKASYKQMLQQHHQPTFILKKDTLFYWHPNDTLTAITTNQDINSRLAIIEPLSDLKEGILQQLQQQTTIKKIEIELDDRNIHQDQFRITMVIESKVQKCKNIYDTSNTYSHHIVPLTSMYTNSTLKNIFSDILRDGYSKVILSDSRRTGIYIKLSSIVSATSVYSCLEKPQQSIYTLTNISAIKKTLGRNKAPIIAALGNDILLTFKSPHNQKYYVEVSTLHLTSLLPRMLSSNRSSYSSDYDQKNHYFISITTENGTCCFKVNEKAETKMYEISQEPDKKIYSENEEQKKPTLLPRKTQAVSIPAKIMTKKSFFNLFIIGLITGFFGPYALLKLMKCLA